MNQPHEQSYVYYFQQFLLLHFVLFQRKYSFSSFRVRNHSFVKSLNGAEKSVKISFVTFDALYCNIELIQSPNISNFQQNFIENKIRKLTYSILPSCAKSRSPRTYFVFFSLFLLETIRCLVSGPGRSAAA